MSRRPLRTRSTVMPPAARRYTLLLCGLAAVALAVAAWHARSDLAEAADPSVVIVWALGTASVVFPLRFYHDHEVQGFNLVSAAFITMALLLPDALAILAAAVMLCLGFAIATRSVVKTAFNTAQTVLAAVVGLAFAWLLVGGELGGDVLAARTLLAVGAIALIFATLSAGLVSELIARHSGNKRGKLLAEIVGPALWVTVSDYFVAILLTILADRSPLAVVLALPIFAGLLFGYRGFAADREAARQAELLHDTSRQLLDGALDDSALEEAVVGLRDLFGAERAALATGESDTPPWLRGVLAEVHRTGTGVLSSEESGVMAAPVRLEGRVVGILVVSGRRGLSNWGPSDLDLLSTIGGEIAATLRTRRLLAQVERERARLAAETSKLTDVLASASDGIVVLDADGKVEACNPAMMSLLGVEQLAVGLPWRDVLRLQDEDGRALTAGVDHPLVAALTGRARVQGTTAALQRPDGEVRWLRCSAAPVLSDGEADGVVLVAVDLTREREVEQLRSDFIATVSHELRTPLTPLSGFLGVMREHGGTLGDDRRAMMVEAMEKQVGRLSDLIGDLLQVAEIDRGLTNVHHEVVDLSRAVEELLDIEAVAADERGRVVTRLHPASAVADRNALRRILRALVSNGFKHTSGTITITTRTEEGRAVVRVRDEGPGIPPSSREAVFEPFHRLGNHLHRTQGPGLGLSVARSLAEALDGTLDIEAPAGGGAEFVLRLPPAAAANGPRVARVVDNAV